MHIPAFELSGSRTYRWCLHDEVPAPSLWVQYEGDDDGVYTREYPIYANTHGRTVWFSNDTDWGEDPDVEPTDAFYECLVQIKNREALEEDLWDECTWYEQEALNALIATLRGRDIPADIHNLIHHARRQTMSDATINTWTIDHDEPNLEELLDEPEMNIEDYIDEEEGITEDGIRDLLIDMGQEEEVVDIAMNYVDLDGFTEDMMDDD